MKTKFATFVSTLGHPFLTLPVFIIFLLFSTEPVAKAGLLTLLIIGGIFIPVGLRTLLGVRKGKYTNLDVSDQAQRQQWFIVITLLLLIVTAIVWITDQNRTLRLGMICAFSLLLVSQLVNTRVKASMHLAFHTFLGLLILHMNAVAGAIFLLFAPLLAWSRLYLKRHVLEEVLVGVVLGGLFGLIFWIIY